MVQTTPTEATQALSSFWPKVTEEVKTLNNVNVFTIFQHFLKVISLIISPFFTFLSFRMISNNKNYLWPELKR